MSYPANSDSVAADQIKSFVRRIEALEDEIKVLNEDKSEVYKEAKGNGFDTKVLRKVIDAHRQDHAERLEQDALFDLYMEALHEVAHAHVEIIEEFDPETGEIKTAGELVAPSMEAADHGTVTDGGAPANMTNTGGENVADRPVHVSEEPGRGAASVNAPAEGDTHSATISEPALAPSEIAEPGDRGAASLAATVVAFRTHNPETHFLNSKGLVRLNGCLKPDLCGSSQPRVRLCHGCADHAAPKEDGAA